MERVGVFWGASVSSFFAWACVCWAFSSFSSVALALELFPVQDKQLCGVGCSSFVLSCLGLDVFALSFRLLSYSFFGAPARGGEAMPWNPFTQALVLLRQGT